MWPAVRWLSWVALFACVALIVENSLRDLGPGGEEAFIRQKGETGQQPLWQFSLRLHVVAGIVCLLSVLPQFSRRLLRRTPALHRWCGRIYALCVLLFLCPTGLHLAHFAKGGPAGVAGFLLLGAATFHTTLRGVTAMLGPSRDLAAHRRWMTRSFALVASAITFRVLHFLFFEAGVPAETNYVASLWISILGNAAVAELVLRHRPRVAALPASIPSIP